MTSESLEAKIAHLRQSGYKLKQIAYECSVSVHVVRGAITRHHARLRGEYRGKRGPAPAEVKPQPKGRIARCKGCGGLVQMPCRLCSVRAIR